MAILTGLEIQRLMGKGLITITPPPARFNPNSVNLRLDSVLRIYYRGELDCRKDNPHHTVRIPDEGYILQPGELYLASTVEWTETPYYVPMIEGRSSLGRLGLSIHHTAGFGDIGFKGHWTLELTTIRPLRIYTGMEICQLVFHTVEGEAELYKGKYQNQTGAVESKLWKDFLSQE